MVGREFVVARRDPPTLFDTGSTEPSNEVKIEAGQRRADLMHRTALSKGPEVDGYEADAINQIDNDLLGFVIIS